MNEGHAAVVLERFFNFYVVTQTEIELRYSAYLELTFHILQLGSNIRLVGLNRPTKDSNLAHWIVV